MTKDYSFYYILQKSGNVNVTSIDIPDIYEYKTHQAERRTNQLIPGKRFMIKKITDKADKHGECAERHPEKRTVA